MQRRPTLIGGFSLIELMLVVTVMGIFAAVAYPSYMDQVRKSRRAEAQSVLMHLANLQQQRLLDARTYASTISALPSFSLPAQVPGFYAISVSAPNSTPPAFTATATPQNDQTKDKCGTLSITQTGIKAAAKDGATQTGCW